MAHVLHFILHFALIHLDQGHFFLDATRTTTNYTPKKTNMTIKHPPFEDVFPVENGDFPMSCWFSGVYGIC